MDSFHGLSFSRESRPLLDSPTSPACHGESRVALVGLSLMDEQLNFWFQCFGVFKRVQLACAFRTLPAYLTSEVKE